MFPSELTAATIFQAGASREICSVLAKQHRNTLFFRRKCFPRSSPMKNDRLKIQPVVLFFIRV
jgi:hypothetical protein